MKLTADDRGTVVCVRHGDFAPFLDLDQLGRSGPHVTVASRDESRLWRLTVMHRLLAVQRSATAEPWYESWFDSLHYHALYAHRDVREAAAFVDRVMNRLPLAPGPTVPGPRLRYRPSRAPPRGAWMSGARRGPVIRGHPGGQAARDAQSLVSSTGHGGRLSFPEDAVCPNVSSAQAAVEEAEMNE